MSLNNSLNSGLVNDLTDKKLVIALSGGVDSVALLNYYKTHSNIRAIHINHNLSPNANKWQNFCQNFCDNLNIKLDIFSLHIKDKNNLEQRARDGRYKILFDNLKDDEILLTAHHKNDQAETVLLNLFRGASSLGLSAMLKQNGKHLRPFLEISRDEIVDYARGNNLEFIEDESNLNNDFRRNFIRNEIIPLIEKNYPSVVNSLNVVSQKQQNTLKLSDDLAKIDIQNNNLIQENLLHINNLQKLEKHRILNVIYFHLRNLKFSLPSSNIATQMYNAIFSKEDAQVKIIWDNYCCYKFNGFLYFLDNSKKDDFCPFYHSLKNKKGFNIRYRKGGEKVKFKHKNHSQKLKKVMQEAKIPYWQRDTLKMYYIEEELVAVEKLGYCSLTDIVL